MKVKSRKGLLSRMSKALEDANPSTDGEYRIDNILEKGTPQEASPLSSIAQLVSQRDSLVEAATKAEEEAKNRAKEEVNGGSDDSGSDDSEENNEEENNEGDNEDSESTDGDDSGSSSSDDDGDDNTDFDDPTSDEEDSGDDDKEKDNEDKDDKDDKDKDDGDDGDDGDVKDDLDNLSFESFVPKKPIKNKLDFFEPVRSVMKQRIRTMAAYGISLEDQIDEVTGAVDNTAVAYTKEAIIESIRNLTEIERKYVAGVSDFNVKIGKAIPKLNERVYNFDRVFKQGKLQFSNKVLTDVALLKNVSYAGVTSPRETLQRMNAYIKDTNDICSLMTNSPFSTIKDIVMSKGFLVTGDILEYNKTLPGFNKVQMALPDFQNYMKTDVSTYQFYSTKDNNPSELYDLVPISITQDKDVIYIVDSIKALIVDLAISNDILKVVEMNFKKFVEELSVLRVEVEDDTHEKLADLGLDEKVQSFIIFKYIVEIVNVNINLTIDYITTLITIVEESMGFSS